ncbi:hypothetical protein EXIGLDRAFT_184915 [Exidia glandulosa HHB12029]|uniref:F-box domain-containing protein n=1 Tax=Exidia glandulosa HHB12029 TaxID=1314781 RepID=A0A165F132_EXIGL|nr:hypothetical protein EXIGLDRAFT_184915 [Exidia glandulosa HHB12029]
MDPASILPVEILRRIVGMSLDEADNRYARLEALATVCHQWREVILGDGMLWNDVYVTPRTTSGQVSKLLQQSARCNLLIHVKGTLDSSSLGRAQLALGQYQRIVELDMDINDDVWLPQITRRLTDASIWPELRHLALSHFTQDPDHDVSLELRIYAPQLRSLDLSGVSVLNWSTLGEALPYLESFSVEWITSAASLLPVLPSFSALGHLKLSLPQESLSADLPPSFFLPHLHSLEIDTRELGADLLSAMASSNSPELTSLSVRFYRVDMRQSRIELSSPRLMNLRIEYTRAVDEPPILIHFRVVPRALQVLELIGVTDDIAALISPYLRTLELAYTDVDVERLGSALSQCQHLDHLVFTGLRSTSAIAREPPATAVLPRLTFAVLAHRINEPLDDEVRRLYVDLLPPTIMRMHIVGTPCPSGEDLRFVLEDISRLSAPTELSLSINDGDGGSFCLMEAVRDYRRIFNVDSGVEYLEILLSQPAFHAHIQRLEVGVAHAIQIIRHYPNGLPLLKVLRISYSANYHQPYDQDKILGALQALADSVPSPIACPCFKILGISVYDHRAPGPVLCPVALKRALVGLFLSQEDEVSVEFTDALKWVE